MVPDLPQPGVSMAEGEMPNQVHSNIAHDSVVHYEDFHRREDHS
jgi:hypothetical protein